MRGYDFTDTARRVMAEARTEANALSHEYIGTEHLLLAVTALRPSLATRVIEAHGVTPDAVREKLFAVIRPGTGLPRADLPFTSRAKTVIEEALDEARATSSGALGTEHLLIGMLREHKGIAAQVLQDAGITLPTARETVATLVTRGERDEAGAERSATPSVRLPEPPRMSGKVAASQLRRILDSCPDAAAVFAKHDVNVDALIDDIAKLD
jgi:ATP-dependent Clp protease ATP-binding subunit ClpC